MSKDLVIIDDDIDDIELLSDAILSADPSIQCSAFTSPHQAIDTLQNKLIVPDVICLDYNMPILNGIECIKILRSFNWLDRACIIASSSNLDPVLEAAFRDEGAYYVFKKPDSLEGYKIAADNILSCFIEQSLD